MLGHLLCLEYRYTSLAKNAKLLVGLPSDCVTSLQRSCRIDINGKLDYDHTVPMFSYVILSA